jgi:DNA-binding transcriptional LysR family regulator
MTSRDGRGAAARQLRRMKLRDLDILSSVVLHGSMAKAVYDLGVSQPAISEAIARLEAAADARLLDRTTRGVEPTVFGLALVKRATIAFDELEQGLREINSLADPTSGYVRVGCPESLAAGLVPEATATLAQHFPNIRVDVALAQPGEQHFRELRERSVDLLVGRLFKPLNSDDVAAEQLCQDAFFVVASANSRWARRRRLSLRDLADERWILFPAGSLSNKFIERGFLAAGLELPRNVVTSFSIQMRLHLLSTGDFLTVLHWSVLKFNTRRWGLKVLPVQLPCEEMPITIFTAAGRTLSPAVGKFVAELRSVASDLDVRRASSLAHGRKVR